MSRFSLPQLTKLFPFFYAVTLLWKENNEKSQTCLKENENSLELSAINRAL